MNFLTSAHTDVGIRKKVNQDSFCLKVASTKIGRVAFAVLCDGMGGLRMGELASSFLVNAFTEWFDTVLPDEIRQGIQPQRIQEQWKNLILRQNVLVKEYGAQQGVSLGTTLTAILIYGTQFIVAHVGDSRLYLINSALKQLTKDHSEVAHKVELGELAPEEAKTYKRRNVLLQCVGASAVVVPQIFVGRAAPNDVFVLCSDGFRHEVSEEEIFGVLAPNLLGNEMVMKKSLVGLVELNKSRGETDNITVIAVKCTE